MKFICGCEITPNKRIVCVMHLCPACGGWGWFTYEDGSPEDCEDCKGTGDYMSIQKHLSEK